MRGAPMVRKYGNPSVRGHRTTYSTMWPRYRRSFVLNNEISALARLVFPQSFSGCNYVE